MKQSNPASRSILTLLTALALIMVTVATTAAKSRLQPEDASRSVQQAATAIPPVPRPTYIYGGSCGQLNEVLWPLNSLISPNGTEGGSVDSDRTEYSFTANVPLTIAAMLSGNYAINVAESAGIRAMSLPAAMSAAFPMPLARW
jgi:hypothetical protein